MITANTHLIDKFEDFERLIKYSSEVKSELIFIDVETNSEIEKKALLYGIGICFNDKRAFYLVWRDITGKEIWTPEQIKYITQWLSEICQKKKLINHNILYDVLVIEYNLGIDLSPYIYSDTILLKHTIDEEPPFALKELAIRDLGPWADKAQQAMKESVIKNGGKWLKKQKDMYKSDTNLLAEYCMWDVLLTYKLFILYSKKLKEEGLEDFFYNQEVMKLYQVTIDMKRKGFPIDVDYFKNLQKEIKENLLRLEDEIIEDIKEDIKPFIDSLLDKNAPIKNSGNLPKILAELCNIPLPKTKEGKITLSAKALQLQKENNPIDSDFYNWILDDNTPLPVSSAKCREAREKILIDKLNKAAEKKGKQTRYSFNLNSAAHLGHYFFNIKGYKPLKNSEKTKKPQVNAAFIDTVTGTDDQAQKIIDYKKLQKLQSTYVDGILSRQLDSKIYTSMLQWGTTSGRFSSKNPNCLSMDTQVLTHKGFKYYHELDENCLVAEFTDSLHWKKPLKIWKSDKILHNLIKIKNQHLDMVLTDNHRVIWQDPKNKEIKESPAKKFPKSASILHGAFCSDTLITINCDFLRFIVAVQADSEIRKDSNRVRFVFHKKRKYQRLLEILKKLSYSFQDKSKGKRFEILIDGCKEDIINTIGFKKIFPNYLIGMSPTCRKVFLEEIFHWDGSFTRKNNYSSNEETNVDFIQILATLEGWRAHKRIYKTIANNNNYQLDFCRRNFSRTANVSRIDYKDICEMWCLEMPGKTFVARRGSDTFITGNCQNLPRTKDNESGLSTLVLKYVNAIRKGFIAPKGQKIVDADYSQLEPCCFATASNDSKLQDIFHKKLDLYSQIAIDVFKMTHLSANKKDDNFLKKVSPDFRNKSKIFTLAVVYGAEESRISQAMNCSYKEAGTTIRAYLNAYPDLKKYMVQCDFEAKTEGKVKTIFGRTRHIPEAKSLYEQYGNKLLDWKYAKSEGLLQERRRFKNYLNNAKNMKIQGLAGHIINKAMIEIYKEFKARKLNAYIALMIHDQIICIADEDIAEEVKQIMQDKMENTTKIAVPLVAEPQIANNLAESH